MYIGINTQTRNIECYFVKDKLIKMFDVRAFHSQYIVNMKMLEKYNNITYRAMFYTHSWPSGVSPNTLRKLNNIKNQQLKEFICQNTIQWIFTTWSENGSL